MIDSFIVYYISIQSVFIQTQQADATHICHLCQFVSRSTVYYNVHVHIVDTHAIYQYISMERIGVHWKRSERAKIDVNRYSAYCFTLLHFILSLRFDLFRSFSFPLVLPLSLFSFFFSATSSVIVCRERYKHGFVNWHEIKINGLEKSSKIGVSYWKRQLTGCFDSWIYQPQTNRSYLWPAAVLFLHSYDSVLFRKAIFLVALLSKCTMYTCSPLYFSVSSSSVFLASVNLCVATSKVNAIHTYTRMILKSRIGGVKTSNVSHG